MSRIILIHSSIFVIRFIVNIHLSLFYLPVCSYFVKVSQFLFHLVTFYIVEVNFDLFIFVPIWLQRKEMGLFEDFMIVEQHINNSEQSIHYTGNIFIATLDFAFLIDRYTIFMPDCIIIFAHSLRRRTNKCITYDPHVIVSNFTRRETE